MSKPLTVLGIETSCDDTAAAVIRWQPREQEDIPHAAQSQILSNEVWTQHEDHKTFGGVVPEIAARSHVERIDGIIMRAMETANLSFDQLDAVCVTAGPGLIGGVLVGLTTAKAIAIAHNLILIPVNHLEGHALSVRMTEDAPYPYLLLLISGGHTQLIKVDEYGSYHRMGTTIDDAAGEAFDKTAKLLGLGQPGGPHIEELAKKGNAERFSLPTPLQKRPSYDFSFSGLKTAVRLVAEGLHEPSPQDIADIAAGFQKASANHLASRTGRAMLALSDGPAFSKSKGLAPRLVVAGGVAANGAIRQTLDQTCQKQGWKMIVPPPKYCTDNGAMIAWAGLERLATGRTLPRKESLSFTPRARWPLAPPPQGQTFGGGKKGPKA